MSVLRQLVVMLFVATSSLSLASEPSIRTGTYSDMHESADGLWGTEIFILRGEDGYFALVQCAQGGARSPELARLTVRADRISFTLKQSGKNGQGCNFSSFSGQVRGNDLTGLFEYSSKILHLRRKRSHWQ